MNKYKINFTNIVKNEDGSFNFSKAEVALGGSFDGVTTHNESNILLGEDVNAGLLARCDSNVQVYVEGEFIGDGTATKEDETPASEGEVVA